MSDIGMQERIESNKLIAEFMGNDTDEYCSHVYVPSKLLPSTKGDCFQGIFAFNECEFDTSWDWLMPVVEKIEEFDEIDVNILLNGTIIFKWKTNEDIINNVADISFTHKIEHTYDAVVRFIKWYNKQLEESKTKSEEEWEI